MSIDSISQGYITFVLRVSTMRFLRTFGFYATLFEERAPTRRPIVENPLWPSDKVRLQTRISDMEYVFASPVR